MIADEGETVEIREDAVILNGAEYEWDLMRGQSAVPGAGSSCPGGMSTSSSTT